jgi:hypothetical protein
MDGMKMKMAMISVSMRWEPIKSLKMVQNISPNLMVFTDGGPLMENTTNGLVMSSMKMATPFCTVQLLDMKTKAISLGIAGPITMMMVMSTQNTK